MADEVINLDFCLADVWRKMIIFFHQRPKTPEVIFSTTSKIKRMLFRILFQTTASEKVYVYLKKKTNKRKSKYRKLIGLERYNSNVKTNVGALQKQHQLCLYGPLLSAGVGFGGFLFRLGM